MDLNNSWQYPLINYLGQDCIYKVSEKQDFVNHASSCHPESIYFLAKIEDESMINVNLPWLNEEKVKFEKKWVTNSTNNCSKFADMALRLSDLTSWSSE